MAILVIHDGEPQLFNFGYSDVKSGTEVDVYMLLEIGSMGKAITSLGLLLFEHQG